jgi:hypothetical protein
MWLDFDKITEHCSEGLAHYLKQRWLSLNGKIKKNILRDAESFGNTLDMWETEYWQHEAN